jgi:hypothetical protein
VKVRGLGSRVAAAFTVPLLSFHFIPLVQILSSFLRREFPAPLSNFDFRLPGAFTQLPELLNKSLSPGLVLCLALEMKFAFFVLVRSLTLSGVDSIRVIAEQLLLEDGIVYFANSSFRTST